MARTAEHAGFEGVLTPTGTFCEDAWLTTAALLRETRTLKFLVAFRPGVINPVLAAQMAAAYQRISGGRLMLNIVTGGEPREQARFGDTAPKAERYARTEEFLRVLRGTWHEAPFTFTGEHFTVSGAQVGGTLEPAPDIYFGGSSGPAGPVAAEHADVYLTWGEPPELVAEKIAWMRGLAAERGRTLRFGLRIHTLSRDTSEEAWAHAQWLLDGLDPGVVAAAQEALRGQRVDRAGSGCSRCATAARRTPTRASWRSRPTCGPGSAWCAAAPAPRWWAATRRSPTGSSEYHAIGIDEVILSGYPHVEEALTFAEGVMPVLRRRGLLAGQPGAVPLPERASA